MIRGFRHKGLKRHHETGATQGIQRAHERKLRRILATLDAAATPSELDLPGYGLHELKGRKMGHFAITVNGNWRVTFTFAGADVDRVDYLDYH